MLELINKRSNQRQHKSRRWSHFQIVCSFRRSRNYWFEFLVLVSGFFRDFSLIWVMTNKRAKE